MPSRGGFPRLYAAASLKVSTSNPHRRPPSRFPRLYAAASLKGSRERPRAAQMSPCFPRLYAAASLKGMYEFFNVRVIYGFPRLYAAASLKGRLDADVETLHAHVFRGFMPRPH